MRTDAIRRNVRNPELLERLNSVTEQLEDIVIITRGKDIKEPRLSLLTLCNQMKKRVGGSVPLVLFSIFRMFALKNLLRGRMHVTAYTVGRQLGLSLKVVSKADLIKELSRFEVGRIAIDRLDNDGVRIRIDGTITSMGIKNSNQPICFFERGLLSGALEKLLKRKVDIVEEKCSSQGENGCVFKANLKEEKKGHVSSEAGIMSEDLYSKENIKLLTTLASHSITAIENTLLFEEAKKRSIIDGLTQVYNHGYFQQIFKTEVMRALRYRTPLSLIMMDIDGFKSYNDRFGHRQGDKVLKVVARLLIDSVRQVDVVARYGGDEFAMILPQTEAGGARFVADRLRKGMDDIAFKGDLKKPVMHLTLSIGVASIDGRKHVNPNALFEKADSNLFRAKKKGKNKVVS